MTTMIAEVYDAFMSAGVDECKARAAAQAIANDEARTGKIESDLGLLTWITRTVFAMVASLVVKAFI
jgi:hypothetical protein